MDCGIWPLYSAARAGTTGVVATLIARSAVVMSAGTAFFTQPQAAPGDTRQRGRGDRTPR